MASPLSSSHTHAHTHSGHSATTACPQLTPWLCRAHSDCEVSSSNVAPPASSRPSAAVAATSARLMLVNARNAARKSAAGREMGQEAQGNKGDEERREGKELWGHVGSRERTRGAAGR